MTKLLKFKSYLTLEEAASYLTNLSDEVIELKDLYGFALEGLLVLSVYHINQCTGYLGHSIDQNQAGIRLSAYNSDNELVKSEVIYPNFELRNLLSSCLENKEHVLIDASDSLRKSLEEQDIYIPKDITLYIELDGRLLPNRSNVIEFNDNQLPPKDSAVGLWNLEIYGAGENYIRHQLRKAIDGKEVTPHIDTKGILLTNSDKTQWFLPCTYSGRCSVTDEYYESAFISFESCYMPSLWFNQDSIVVVSRIELDRFIASFSNPKETACSLSKSQIDFHENTSELLKIAIRTNHEFWSTFDPSDLHTAPLKKEVLEWLSNKFTLSNAEAKAIDTVLRGSRAAPGGRPTKNP